MEVSMRAAAAFVLAILTTTVVLAAPPGEAPAPKDKPAAPAVPAAPAATCKLLTPEAPRGGMLEVEGDDFGKTPVVRIGGTVTRTIERRDKRVSVQIPRDSNGGKVTVQVGKTELDCGSLTIIGKN
jgi:hypothetical protein